MKQSGTYHASLFPTLVWGSIWDPYLQSTSATGTLSSWAARCMGVKPFCRIITNNKVEYSFFFIFSLSWYTHLILRGILLRHHWIPKTGFICNKIILLLICKSTALQSENSGENFNIINVSVSITSTCLPTPTKCKGKTWSLQNYDSEKIK